MTKAAKYAAVVALSIFALQFLIEMNLKSSNDFKRVHDYIYHNPKIIKHVGDVMAIRPQGRTVASASGEYADFTDYELYVKGSSSSAVILVREYRSDNKSEFSIRAVR